MQLTVQPGVTLHKIQTKVPEDGTDVLKIRRDTSGLPTFQVNRFHGNVAYDSEQIDEVSAILFHEDHGPCLPTQKFLVLVLGIGPREHRITERHAIYVEFTDGGKRGKDPLQFKDGRVDLAIEVAG